MRIVAERIVAERLVAERLVAERLSVVRLFPFLFFEDRRFVLRYFLVRFPPSNSKSDSNNFKLSSPNAVLNLFIKSILSSSFVHKPIARVYIYINLSFFSPIYFSFSSLFFFFPMVLIYLL